VNRELLIISSLHMIFCYPLFFYICIFFRERQIKEIIASFEACKRPPVHATNKNLKPVEVLPLLPYFDR